SIGAFNSFTFVWRAVFSSSAFTIFSLASPNLSSASSTRSFNVAICCLYLSWQMSHIIPTIGTASTATADTNGRGQFHATSQKPGSPAMTIAPIPLQSRRERSHDRRAAPQRDELAPFLIEWHVIPHDERGPHRRISNWRRSVSGDSHVEPKPPGILAGADAEARYA